MNFVQKNWVFISGAIAATVVALQQAVTSAQTDWKVVGFSVLMGLLAYVANQWRGKGPTVVGIIGVLAATFSTIQMGQVVNWNQLIIMSLIAVGLAVAPPPKPAGYEKTSTIEDAKAEGKLISDK